MEITKEEFQDKFREGLDIILLALAEHEDVDPGKFYAMTCIVENLTFFSPVLFGLLRPPEK